MARTFSIISLYDSNTTGPLPYFLSSKIYRAIFIPPKLEMGTPLVTDII
jgi:hypothetical protein